MSKLFNQYYNQSNNPDDLYHDIWNTSQVAQQHRLGLVGSSWSQPPWNGWKPIIGAGDPTLRNDWFQRYAQDGDSGFFKSRLFGRGDPVGLNPHPLNHLVQDYSGDNHSIELPNVSTMHPLIEPTSQPQLEELEVDINSSEPQQRATHVPPYSQTIMNGLGHAVKDDTNVLYSQQFEIPKYKGFQKKK